MVSLEKLKHLKVGESLNLDSKEGCYTLINHENEFKRDAHYPKNGEFVYDGFGIDCASSFGRTGRLKRVAFKADHAKCVETGKEIVDGKTCPHDIPNRDTHLANYCGQNSRTVSESRCRDLWKRKSPSSMIDALKSYCKENPKNELCKTLNKTWMDKIAQDFCDENPDDPYCGCLSLSANQKKLKEELEKRGQTLIPWCNLSSCMSSPESYKPTFARNFTCPSQQVCLQGVDLDDIGGSASLENVSFDCTFSRNQNSATQAQDDSSSDETSTETSTETKEKSTVIFNDIKLSSDAVLALSIGGGLMVFLMFALLLKKRN